MESAHCRNSFGGRWTLHVPTEHRTNEESGEDSSINFANVLIPFCAMDLKVLVHWRLKGLLIQRTISLGEVSLYGC